MREQLLIIGAGGHGRVIADIALKMNTWKTIAFLDNDKLIQSSMGLEVVGKSDDMLAFIDDWDIFVGIGNNALRERIQSKLEVAGAHITTLIHPRAVIGEQVELGVGTAVMAGVVINCCTKVGKGCIINTGATIDHDSLIENYVHVSPGVHMAGTVNIGAGAWLGIGSIVSNNVNITSNCIIGAGAVVVRDIVDAGTYMGVPARRVY
ncbi:sugar O-acyltransferase, sialic acid O-acetyltransferase NeuD family [Paenibacillus sp. UNCCL117]|uniref:acetyltransferase n=1 Tax=unclassified Paenibacillus TaxID=185978 RepID=UPI000884D1E4|nr:MULTISPECIES: acetyltransferase [unclassified Paenibacillus]SDC04177.1 sugar O-acyltransferase, sialic acid O-acetyltransferase NeuD family [Paenibacillus sp. cl123]SFW37263.1 sugar O-acyltransferase, sialic acid O-acetyltransferase NeuD family [Paenibacillus sp. UNCCL117]